MTLFPFLAGVDRPENTLMDPLRVALIAPVWLPVPPPGYGGTERVVHLLAEELTRRGQDVTPGSPLGRSSGTGEASRPLHSEPLSCRLTSGTSRRSHLLHSPQMSSDYAGTTGFDSWYRVRGERSAPFGQTIVPESRSTRTCLNSS
jgi:hypothetical protein